MHGVPVFYPLKGEGCMSCFQFGAIMAQAAISICRQQTRTILRGNNSSGTRDVSGDHPMQTRKYVHPVWVKVGTLAVTMR